MRVAYLRSEVTFLIVQRQTARYMRLLARGMHTKWNVRWRVRWEVSVAAEMSRPTGFVRLYARGSDVDLRDAWI